MSKSNTVSLSIEDLINNNNEYNSHPLIEGRIMQKIDFIDAWEESDIILLPGELGIGLRWKKNEQNENTNTIDNYIEIVVGDGQHTYQDLTKISSDITELAMPSLIAGKNNQSDSKNSGYGIIGDNNILNASSSQSFVTGYLNTLAGKYSGVYGISNDVNGNYSYGQGAFNTIKGEGNQGFGLGNMIGKVKTYGIPLLFLNTKDIPYGTAQTQNPVNGSFYRTGGKVYQRLQISQSKTTHFNNIEGIPETIPLKENGSDFLEYNSNTTYNGSSWDLTYCKIYNEEQKKYDFYKLIDNKSVKNKQPNSSEGADYWESIELDEASPKYANYKFTILESQTGVNFTPSYISTNNGVQDLIYIKHMINTVTSSEVPDYSPTTQYDGSSFNLTYCKIKDNDGNYIYYKLKENKTISNQNPVDDNDSWQRIELNSIKYNVWDQDLVRKSIRYRVINELIEESEKQEETSVLKNQYYNSKLVGFQFAKGEYISSTRKYYVLKDKIETNDYPYFFVQEDEPNSDNIKLFLVYNLKEMLYGFNNEYYLCFYPQKLEYTGNEGLSYWENIEITDGNPYDSSTQEENNIIREFNYNTPNFSYCLGNYNITNHSNTYLLGDGLISKAEGQSVFGSFNIPWENGLLILGNGTDDSERSNAFGIRKTDGALIFPKNSANTHGGSIRVNSNSEMVLSVTGSRALMRFNSIDGQTSNGYVFRENRFTPEQSNTIDLAQPGIRFKTGYLHTTDINSALVDTEYIKEKTDKTGTEPHQIREGILFSKKVTEINEETKKEIVSYPHFSDIYLDHGTNSLILGSVNNIAIRPHGTIYNGQKVTTNSKGISTITNSGIIFSDTNICPEQSENNYSLGKSTNRFQSIYGRQLNLKSVTETHDYGGSLPNAITLLSSGGTQATGIGISNDEGYTLFGSTSYFYFKPQGNDKFGNGSKSGIKIMTEGIIPQTNNTIGLGSPNFGFNKLYLGDNISFNAEAGNSNKYDKLSIVASHNIILQSGKNNNFATFMKLGASEKLLKFSFNGTSLQIAPNSSGDTLALGTSSNKVTSINGVTFPTSGTYTLKCVNGNLTWVSG